MEISVRPAHPDDLPTIVDFNCRLAEETEGLLLDRATVERGVANLMQCPAYGRYYVAVISGEVVGQLMITYEWSDWRNGQIWWIQSVYVASQARRCGVFRRLYEHVLEESRRNPEIVGLRLYVEEHNTKAQSTYHSLGMRAAGYLVHENLFREIPRCGPARP